MGMLNYIAAALWQGIYVGGVIFGALVGFSALVLLVVSLGAMIGWICRRLSGEGEADD